MSKDTQSHKQTNRRGKRKAILGPASRTQSVWPAGNKRQKKTKQYVDEEFGKASCCINSGV